MIVDKKNKLVHSEQSKQVVGNDLYEDLPMLPDDDNVTIEEVEANPLEQIYYAVRRVLESLHVNPEDDTSPLLFQTIKIDNGQFERIVRSKENTEYAIAFPAAFIRFVNVRYLVAQQRIGEGRATMRIRFVLNDLNNSDDYVETHGFRVFNQINTAIQDAKDKEPALNERCNLTYFDMPESLDNGLQPYWIDYEVWFRTSSAFQYRNWVDRYLVMPPFTNHSDATEHDTDNHGDHKTPIIEEVAKFEPSVEIEQPETPETDDTEDE